MGTGLESSQGRELTVSSGLWTRREVRMASVSRALAVVVSGAWRMSALGWTSGLRDEVCLETTGTRPSSFASIAETVEVRRRFEGIEVELG